EVLRRGLVAVYRDDTRPQPTEIIQLDPTIALALGSGDAAHPRLHTGGTVSWKGHVKIVRPGKYRFSMRLRGRFLLIVGGKEALKAEVKEEKPVLIEGPELDLEAGVLPLRADFTRLPGLARVEVFWQAAYFRREPLSYDLLGHLSEEEPQKLIT